MGCLRLTPAPASQVRVRSWPECPIALECRVIHRLTLGSHDLFLGQVVAVQVDDGLLAADGRPDYTRTQPLAYVGGDYWQMGGPAGHYGDWRPAKGTK